MRSIECFADDSPADHPSAADHDDPEFPIGHRADGTDRYVTLRRARRCSIGEGPQTWHYGLVAKWWSEFNDEFRPHEVPYFRRFIEDDGQPALDVGCGTGRLLIPYLRAGLDVDGCDVSADMVDLCREKAEREGLSPDLYVQPMYELNLPRRYRTIFVCG
jgi:2-polyprenyl-3-methyl-5-hydroxy-6-metoxy-1,4-benzoquinol methylase